MVATYEKTEFESINFVGYGPGEIARAAYDLSFEKPVCSAAAMSLIDGEKDTGHGFELAVYNQL
jgi:IMP cyclohydrolase